ncbi:penicillin-binding protein 2 [Candidatus Uhrbacteria bacterium]|nr:penicillin-binding protein 2 [Candidatus Uhrbacteria bacterium]
MRTLSWSRQKRHHNDAQGASQFPHTRLLFFRGVIVMAALFFGYRLFDLQILSYADYREAADGVYTYSKKLVPKRGEIFVRDLKGSLTISNGVLKLEDGSKLFPAVANREYATVYAVPKYIADPIKTAELLAPLLGYVNEEKKDEIKKEEGEETDAKTKDSFKEKTSEEIEEPEVDQLELLRSKLAKPNDLYEVLKRKVDTETVEKLRQLSIGGIGFSPVWYRTYPEKGLGGQLFGYVGYRGDEERGLYGLEGYYNEILKGKEGSLRLETDARGALIPIGDKRVVEAIDGDNIVLTIDRTVQIVACDRLKAWVGKHQADGGTVIILDPKTGAIIAMCSVPDFDPDNYRDYALSSYNNPAIFTPYEPGSIFKPITMAIGIELGLVDPNTMYTDTGSVTLNSFTIKNSDNKAHGKQTMTDVLNKSLNTGVIFVARKIGIERFRNFVKDFGFGSLTGIEMDTEVPGNISSLQEKREIYLATASFGQGITVTPLQIAAAYGALANGGDLMQPYIVDEIVKPDGKVKKTEPKIIRRVISERTASLLGGMMVTVVRKGHGKRAGVEGYFVAGKTGTAQVPRKDGRGYDPNVTIGSFAGFAPVDDPKFVMLVKIDRPRSVQWAESSAAPLFGEIAEFLLHYFEIPPGEKVESE